MCSCLQVGPKEGYRWTAAAGGPAWWTERFNISGAKNSDPGLPAGTDLNGLYAKTSRACGTRPTWQQGGSAGPVLYWDPGGSDWRVGASDALASCDSAHDYLFVRRAQGAGESPASPDGAGCAGRWAEKNAINPIITVAAVGPRSNNTKVTFSSLTMAKCNSTNVLQQFEVEKSGKVKPGHIRDKATGRCIGIRQC